MLDFGPFTPSWRQDKRPKRSGGRVDRRKTDDTRLLPYYFLSAVESVRLDRQLGIGGQQGASPTESGRNGKIYSGSETGQASVALRWTSPIDEKAAIPAVTALGVAKEFADDRHPRRHVADGKKGQIDNAQCNKKTRKVLDCLTIALPLPCTRTLLEFLLVKYLRF